MKIMSQVSLRARRSTLDAPPIGASSVERRAWRVVATLALLSAAACTADVKPDAPRAVGNPDPLANTYAPDLKIQLPAFYKTPNGVYYQDTKVGTGMVAAPGAQVTAKYTGWLPDGTQFDSGTYPFRIGGGMVIAGWDEGVQGMKVGGVRKLVIPAALGYGETGSPPDIPPNATLVFEVELVDVK
jgi:peptidylprolyl isomerase